MNRPQSSTRYNQRIHDMRDRASSGLRLGWLISFLLATVFLPSSLCASSLGDAARQLARKIAVDSGPGALALELVNRSSLDDKSVREVRSALEAELHAEGVHTAKPEQAMGTVEVVLSESLREYVWTAEIVIGSDERKVALVSLPRSPTGTPFAAALPIVLKTTLLFAQERPMLDVALVEMPGGPRLLVLDDDLVAIYRHQAANPAGGWELETSLPIAHSHAFPRDVRGRLLLRRDRLFDVYLPGTFCRTNSIAPAPLTLTCNDSDDPWPLTPEEGSVRAFFAASRNFFTGALSPGIGKVSNVPSFYSAAALPRSSYTLWVLAAVDGSLHLADGMTDQAIRGAKWGSDVAAVRSSCGTGPQVLISENGDAERDGLRAFEIPDRDPVPVSSAVEFDGRGVIVALWPESGGNGAAAIVKRKDTGWYEAYRVSISCGN
ncbi:MAG: hypothetical protein ABSD64_14600 [Terriglobales bacterium]|jgi:hypothetical protein